MKDVELDSNSVEEGKMSRCHLCHWQYFLFYIFIFVFIFLLGCVIWRYASADDIPKLVYSNKKSIINMRYCNYLYCIFPQCIYLWQYTTAFMVFYQIQPPPPLFITKTINIILDNLNWTRPANNICVTVVQISVNKIIFG